MQNIIVLVYKGLRRLKHLILSPFQYLITGFLFYCNNVKRKTFQTKGIPFVSVARGAKFNIGNNFRMNNSIESNPIGRIQKCIFFC